MAADHINYEEDLNLTYKVPNTIKYVCQYINFDK